MSCRAMTVTLCCCRKRMLAEECLKHRWLSQDITYMRAKKLSTSKHKKFLARRKWQVKKWIWQNISGRYQHVLVKRHPVTSSYQRLRSCSEFPRFSLCWYLTRAKSSNGPFLSMDGMQLYIEHANRVPAVNLKQSFAVALSSCNR